MDTPQPTPPPHGQPAPPVIKSPHQYTDGFGIASIVMAALFFTIPGLILGIIGDFRARSNNASPVLSRIGWIANLIMLLFGIVLAIAFFGIVIKSDEFKVAFNEHAKTSMSEKEFSADTFSIRAPHGFSDMSKDNPGAALSIGNETLDIYLLGYAETADNIANGTTLDQYANQAYESFASDNEFSEQKRERLAAGTINNPLHLNVLDYKIQANYGISKFIYYDRYIKTNDGFYMLTTWTTPDKLDENSATIKSILSSFKETAAKDL